MRFPMRRTILTTAATLALVLATAGSTLATQPGVNGRITFMRSDQDGQFQIFVANSDMGHQSQITPGTSDGWFPSWAPDGSKIVFASHSSDPDPNDEVEIMDVFTMRPDGTDVRKVTDSLGYSGTPSWSPDGRWIVFSADRAAYPQGQGIYLIRSNGSGSPRRITSLPASSVWQELGRFSPDGKSIVFNEVRIVSVTQDDGSTVEIEQSALFTVRPNGTNLRRVTPWDINASDADWSPDGRRLVFGSRPPTAGGLQEVMIADADGDHLRNLSRDHPLPAGASPETYVESFNPAWSPDGRSIVFVHATWTPDTGFQMGLQVMRPDGFRRTWLSTGEEHQPDWGSAPNIH